MNIIEAIQLLKKDDSNLLDVTLGFVQSEISGIYKDISKIHLISAEQAFISATRSNNSEAEIRVAIGHLRDSFNAYQVYLDKGTTVLVFWQSKWDAETSTLIQLKLASLAFVISLIYKKLNDENNYLSWKNVGLFYAKGYISNKSSYLEEIKRNIEVNPLIYQANGAGRLLLEYKEIYRQEKPFLDSFLEITNQV
jgi:hypothetical protein